MFVKFWRELSLWGKINLLLLSSVFLGIFVLFFLIVFEKKTYVVVEVIGSENNGYYQLQQPGWLVDTLKIGSSEKSFTGQKIAEVLSIKKYEQGSNKDSVMKIRLMVAKNNKNNTFRYRQKPLEVGSKISLLLDNSRINGTVMSIGEDGKEETPVYKIVRVAAFYKRPEYAAAIKVGDKGVDEYSGVLEYEILKVDARDAETSAYTDDGRVLPRRDSRFKDIYIDLKVNVKNRGGAYFFENYQMVKVGNSLWFPFKDYNLNNVEIVGIEDVK